MFDIKMLPLQKFHNLYVFLRVHFIIIIPYEFKH